MTRASRRAAFAVEFGQRVRRHRADRGWSQEELAERAGLHWTYVGSVERGERNLSLLNVLRIAGALDVDPGALVGGITSPDH